MSEFNESDHPRDDKGRFGTISGTRDVLESRGHKRDADSPYQLHEAATGTQYASMISPKGEKYQLRFGDHPGNPLNEGLNLSGGYSHEQNADFVENALAKRERAKSDWEDEQKRIAAANEIRSAVYGAMSENEQREIWKSAGMNPGKNLSFENFQKALVHAKPWAAKRALSKLEKRDALAMDASVRTFDKDGAMHIARTNIAKAGVNPYRGSEIVDWQRLGLLPDKIYNLFRDPEELRKGASTFARKFILSEHVPVPLYDTMEEQELKKLIVGTIGSDIEWDDPFVTADVCIADKQAIVGIDTDTVREFSPSYYYKPLMLSGEYKGESYDIVMTDIRANHLCLVEEGRHGPDVLAADSALRDTTMKITKFGKALIAALGSLSPKLAADSKFKPLLAEQTRKTFDRAEIRKQLLAMDADMPAENVDAVMDAMLDDEPHPKDCDCKACKTANDADEDETPEEKKKRLAKEKAAEDEDDDETPEEKKKKRLAKEKAAEDEDTEKKVKTAMDSMRVEMRETNEALKAVAPVVGELAMDSASDIYAFALDHMKVDRKGVTGTANLRALFNLANSQKPAAPAVAMDAAGVVAKFPGAARFRTI